MYRCGVRLHGFLHHVHNRLHFHTPVSIPAAFAPSSVALKSGIASFCDSLRRCSLSSSLGSVNQLYLHLSRFDSSGVGEVTASMTEMDYSTQGNTGLAQRCWLKCRKEAYMALYNPFVVSLAAGTLPKLAFQRYIAQDAYFLEAFKTAYQMALESTKNEEAKAIIEALKQAVQEELEMHASLMQSWGVTDSCLDPNTATVAYCTFLQVVATRKDEGRDSENVCAQIIAAMTPCMRLYAFLGREIQKYIKQVPDHPYQKWIQTYSAADFEAAALRIECLLDMLTATLHGNEERAVLESLYRQAMNLEVDFFSAHILGPVHVPFFKCEAASRKRHLLVSDFDSTCTISDSCPVLADLTVQKAGKIHDSRSLGEAEASMLRQKWDALVMQYMNEYKEILEQYLPDNGHGCSKAFSAEDLHNFLKKMSQFEQQANARVEDAAVLKGLSSTDIQEGGSSMPLRSGCSDFFKRLSSQEVHVYTHILSVCWSTIFIEAALENDDVRIPNIHANELVFEGKISTGKIIRNVETALDKERHLVQLMDLLKGMKSCDTSQELQSAYVGDSLTDLLCLLRADVGIVLGESSTLQQVYGERLTPLFCKAIHEEQAYMQGSQQPTGCVYTVSSWHEVEAFLLGPDRSLSTET